MNFESQIKIPSNVSLSLKGGYVRVLGPLGESKTKFISLDPRGGGKISKLNPLLNPLEGQKGGDLLLSFVEKEKGKSETLTKQTFLKRGEFSCKETNNPPFAGKDSALPLQREKKEREGKEAKGFGKLSVPPLEISFLHHLSPGKQPKEEGCENSFKGLLPVPRKDRKERTGLQEKVKRGAYVEILKKMVSNKIQGVSSGFALTLKIKGVGFRVKKIQRGEKQSLVFKMGYSHQVEYQLPESVFAFVFGQTVFCLFGLNKNQVSQVAHKIQEIRQPDIYKGKGIRFANQEVRVKEGKRK